MKTVKDYICELDAKQLVDEYFRKYSRQLSEYYFEGLCSEEAKSNLERLTVIELAEKIRSNLFEYIEFLKTIEIRGSEDGKQGIIYAFNTLTDDLDDSVCTELINREDLIEDPEKCENYGYMLSPFSEILGFLVADNKYTQNHIYEVIADVMWEASWFGYRQERLEEELESLNEAEEQVENGEYLSVDEAFADILGEEEYQRMKDREYKETEESQKLKEAARHAIYEYENCSMMRERRILLSLL